uniref:Neprosin PEP catalytic domain-containing protein n=1 Tax=Ananas comosus var. bracteatus TaxID=296719 RepID=A0A6V7P681_ANACO|nr:unnamed protein product [Ananas comosus var. bracteatus]
MQWAVYETKDSDGPFYGAKAQLNVYAVPTTKSNQISSSNVWLSSGLGGPIKDFNSIQAGWQVNPTLYHDYDVHFYVFWTADGYVSTGCFDLLCKGFVLDNSTKLKPGNIMTPVSKYDGPQRYFTLRIQKNLQTGDWWLHRDDGDDAGPVGYWPKSLFTTLADNASSVQWGGCVRTLTNDNGPPMGSGHFSSEGEGKAAYIKNIKVVNSLGDIYTVIESMWAGYETNDSDVQYYGAEAQLNVYAVPNTKSNQVSSSNVWLSSGLDGPTKNFNSIQAGWQVNPVLYHDYDVHFYVFWTMAMGQQVVLTFNVKNGKGFNYHPIMARGYRPLDESAYARHDSKTGDWWLYKDDEDNTTMPIGYWPNSLFTTLQQNASNLEWGGYVRFWKSDKSPPMGSGHFPSEGEGKAASLGNIKFISISGGIYSPAQEMISSYVDRKDCYDVGDYETSNKNGVGTHERSEAVPVKVVTARKLSKLVAGGEIVEANMTGFFRLLAGMLGRRKEDNRLRRHSSQLDNRRRRLPLDDGPHFTHSAGTCGLELPPAPANKSDPPITTSPAAITMAAIIPAGMR